MPSSKPYVHAFNGLRGLAILLVLVHHIGLFYKWPVGPDIFFVLSGFLITRSLRAQAGRPALASLGSFYRRRLLRLSPPLLALLATLYPMMMLMPDVTGDVRRGMLAALSYTTNWQQVLTPGESRALGHLWSLAAEQQFYLLWPPVFLFFPRRWTRHLLVFLACAAVAWRLWLCGQGVGYGRIYFGLDTHADALLVGCLLALTAVPPRLAPSLAYAGALSLAALTVMALVVPEPSARTLGLSMTMTTGLAALVVASVGANGSRALDQILALPPLQAAGRMSYSLYLWHFPVIAFCRPHWPHGVTAAQLALVLISSTAAYHVVEKPLARYLGTRRIRVVPDEAHGSVVLPKPA